MLSDHEAVAEDLYTCLQWIKKKPKTSHYHKPNGPTSVQTQSQSLSEKMDHAGAFYLNTVNMHRGVVAWLTSLSVTLLEYRGNTMGSMH